MIALPPRALMIRQPVSRICAPFLLCLRLQNQARTRKSGAHRRWSQRAKPPGPRWTIRAAQLTMVQDQDRNGRNWVSDADRPTKDPGGEHRKLYLMMACG